MDGTDVSIHISDTSAIFIGYLIHCLLLGTFCSEIYEIFSPDRNHTRLTRILTYLSILLSILDTIAITRIVWALFIKGWGIEEVFVRQTIEGRSAPACIGLVVLIVQGFFAWRNWRDNGRRSSGLHTAISFVVAVLAVIQCTGAIATASLDIGSPQWTESTTAYRVSMGIWLGASFLCNIAIYLTTIHAPGSSRQEEWLFALGLSAVHFSLYYRWQMRNWYIGFSYALFCGYANILALTIRRETCPLDTASFPSISSQHHFPGNIPFSPSSPADMDSVVNLKNPQQRSLRSPALKVMKDVQMTTDRNDKRGRKRSRSSTSIVFVKPDESNS